MDISKIIELARGGREVDLVLKNARLVNVFSGDIHPIPELKLTDKGIVDVEKFQIVPLFVKSE